MITVYRNNEPPYGLQDMIFDRMEVKDNNLVLFFPEGLIRNEEPYRVVNGFVVLSQVDFESSFVHILSRYAMVGEFEGNKIELLRFMRDFRYRDFEVSNEYHGKNSTIYKGYFSVFNGENLVVEAMVEISHKGDVVYETQE
jgi:hypothetical protein